MSRTCKTCKHWTKHNKDVYHDIFEPEDPDTWEPIPLEFEVRYCRSPLLGFYERPVVKTGACVVDGSAYRAELITAPNFGCVNYEGKTP